MADKERDIKVEFELRLGGLAAYEAPTVRIQFAEPIPHDADVVQYVRKRIGEEIKRQESLIQRRWPTPEQESL